MSTQESEKYSAIEREYEQIAQKTKQEEVELKVRARHSIFLHKYICYCKIVTSHI